MLSARPLSIHEDGPCVLVNTKTPGRALKGRNALQENLVHRGAITVNGKGKLAQTPYHPAVQGQKGMNEGKPIVTVSRPLLDKTPFPNRAANAVPFKTPAPQTTKLAKLSLLEPAPVCTPGALLRPSSLRKSLRAPRSSGRPSFETPATQGNHWDVSDGEVSMEVEVEEREAEQEEDYDELEYMPPSVTDAPYEPPFDMPDYNVAGRQLFELAHSCPIDDSAEQFYAADIDTVIDINELLAASGFASSPSKWDHLELPELEDDGIFHAKDADNAPAKLISKPTSRLSASRVVPTPRPAPVVRPPTVSSTRTSSRTTASSATTSSATRPTTNASSTTVPSKALGSRLLSTTTTTIKPKSSIYATTGATTTQPSAGNVTRSVTTAQRAPATAAKAKASVYATTTAVTTSKPAPKRSSSTSTTATARPAPIVQTRAPTTSTVRTRAVSGAAASRVQEALTLKDSLVLQFDVGGGSPGDEFKFSV